METFEYVYRPKVLAYSVEDFVRCRHRCQLERVPDWVRDLYNRNVIWAFDDSIGLAVGVKKSNKLLGHSTGWIVQHGQDVKIVSDEEFVRDYEPVHEKNETA